MRIDPALADTSSLLNGPILTPDNYLQASFYDGGLTSQGIMSTFALIALPQDQADLFNLHYDQRDVIMLRRLALPI